MWYDSGMRFLLTVVLFGYGVVLGSFINALVWRLRQQGVESRAGKNAQRRKPTNYKLPTTNYSILRGRSMCPSCKHQLAARDLVPVLSWVSLRGRCRYCHKPISVQYLLVELLTGVLFVVFYLGWSFPLWGLHLVLFGFGLVYLVFFVALGVYDAKWYLLPDRLVFPLVGVAAAAVAVKTVWLKDWSIVGQAVFAAAIIFGLFWGLYQVSGGRWIGGGDVKLSLALGMIVGTPLAALLVLFLASLLGTLASVPLLLKSKTRQGLARHIPFGPYLLAATFVTMLWGERLVAWYQSLILSA